MESSQTLFMYRARCALSWPINIPMNGRAVLAGLRFFIPGLPLGYAPLRQTTDFMYEWRSRRSHVISMVSLIKAMLAYICVFYYLASSVPAHILRTRGIISKASTP
jgi:hypothetical protein